MEYVKPTLNKQECQAMAPEGWSYGGYDHPFYLYMKGDYQTGFREMLCLLEDMTPENLALMGRMNLTRIEK